MLDRREPLTPALRHFFQTGEAPPRGHPERAPIYFFALPGDLEDLWREHGAAITAAWTATHSGARPWGWERWGAPHA